MFTRYVFHALQPIVGFSYCCADSVSENADANTMDNFFLYFIILFYGSYGIWSDLIVTILILVFALYIKTYIHSFQTPSQDILTQAT